jgi:hypothetical protein
MSGGLHVQYEGVTFDNVRAALCAIYFWRKDMPVEEWKEALRYVVPSQHNFENPIEPGSQDTWIQYWIDSDGRETQDYNQYGENRALKIACISVRFLGKRAEMWAKAFHHLIQRKSVPVILQEYCNATMLEHVSPIVPINVDYFGVGNTTVAHDLSFMLTYMETIKLGWQSLEYISVAPGKIISGDTPAGG